MLPKYDVRAGRWAGHAELNGLHGAWLRRCDGEGRMVGGLSAVPGFGWWPIKAYRPCPELDKRGVDYVRWVRAIVAWCVRWAQVGTGGCLWLWSSGLGLDN